MKRLLALLAACLLVIPAVTATADTPTVRATSAGTQRVGAAANVWGTVQGAAEGTVWTEVNTANGWSRSQVTTSDANGYYVLPLTYGINSAGVKEFRVGAETPTGTVYSEPFQFTRTAVVSAASAGTKVVGAGTSAWGGVTGVGSTTVSVEVKTGSGWSRSQSGTTSSTGNYTLPLTYGSTTIGKYEFRVVAETPAGPAYSAPFTLTRTGAVSAVTSGSKPVGQTANVWGTVSGVRGGSVWTEVQTSTGWARSQSGTSTSTGYYALPLTYGAGTVGTYTFRVGASTPLGNVYSAPVTITRTAPVVTNGFRPDARCMTGRVFCASKSQRKMAWMIDGQIIEVMEARFGRAGYETRNGKNRIYWKNKDHVSSLYNVAMPYSMFFDGGQAIHYSANFERVGYNFGSAGCINLRPISTAARQFERARVGDWVVVYN